MKKSQIRIAAVIFALLLLIPFYYYGRGIWVPIYQKVAGKETVISVIEKYGKEADKRLIKHFEKANIEYPPKSIKLLALKEEKLIELWALDKDEYKWVTDFRIKAASGVYGPKLRQGDEQVPEGFYKVVGLNPNSSYHLSMKLNYPNGFDLKHAKNEGRDKPGNNIFIHGKAVSIGCLAMGDRAIEELFTLVYRVGKENTEVLIAPTDPRRFKLAAEVTDPKWVAELYENISKEFTKYKR